jgi:pimeloyl-ACP methyl ester carboxylesterase
MRTFALLLMLGCCFAAQSSLTSSQAKPVNRSLEITPEHISFTTEDGAVIYGDLYGTGDRGVVLAHGGRFTKESWQPQADQLARAGFHVLAFDFRGFGKSHGPGDSNMYSAPMRLDVIAAVNYLRNKGTRDVAVVGASFGGSAAVDACIASQRGQIQRLILLASEPSGPADKIKVPILLIVARNDTSGSGLRLPRIRAWFEKVPEPKKLILLDGSAHAQFLFQTDQGERVMREILSFVSKAEATK